MIILLIILNCYINYLSHKNDYSLSNKFTQLIQNECKHDSIDNNNKRLLNRR